MTTLTKSPYERAKKHSRFGKCSVSDLRREIKNDFKKRLIYRRRESVDKNRDLLGVGHIIEEGYKEIQGLLLSDREAVQFLDQNNLYSLLDDVQTEILHEELQKQAENREREEQQEINAIIDGSPIQCNVCETIIGANSKQSVICDNCIKHFESEI